MNREVISKFKDKTFCDIGIDLTTSELGSSPVKNYRRAGGPKILRLFSFPRVRRAAFDPSCFGGSEIAGVYTDEVTHLRKPENLSKFSLETSKGGLGGFARFPDGVNKPTVNHEGTVQMKLPLSTNTCTKCGVNEAFWSSTWCDECLTNLLHE